jgi:hypothetical protein
VFVEADSKSVTKTVGVAEEAALVAVPVVAQPRVVELQ